MILAIFPNLNDSLIAPRDEGWTGVCLCSHLQNLGHLISILQVDFVASPKAQCRRYGCIWLFWNAFKIEGSKNMCERKCCEQCSNSGVTWFSVSVKCEHSTAKFECKMPTSVWWFAAWEELQSLAVQKEANGSASTWGNTDSSWESSINVLVNVSAKHE